MQFAALDQRRISPSLNFILSRRNNEDSAEEVQRKGLSATPSSTLPWSARPVEGSLIVRIACAAKYIYSVVIYKPFFCTSSANETFK